MTEVKNAVVKSSVANKTTKPKASDVKAPKPATTNPVVKKPKVVLSTAAATAKSPVPKKVTPGTVPTAEKPTEPTKKPKELNEAKVAVAKPKKEKINGPRTDVNRWSNIKIDLLMAMKKGAFTSASKMATPLEISNNSDGRLTESQVRHQLNPKYDLVKFGYIEATKHEGERDTKYHLTPKGVDRSNKKFE
jgi:hypothetical protein